MGSVGRGLWPADARAGQPRSAAADRARSIETLDASIEDDLRYLATHTAFRQLLQESRPGGREAAREAAESAFLSFSQGRRAYYQVRYIDGAEREVARVD